MKLHIQIKPVWFTAFLMLAFLAFISLSFTGNSEETNTAIKVEASDATSNPFIGAVVMFAGNFAPRGWALCDGQLLPINQNQALFSILGTTYGGDGRTTFGLPDLRGRVPLHAGQGPGLTNYKLGQKGGSETVVMPKAMKVDAKRSGDVKMVSAGSNPSNVQPYNTVNYIIALQGVYPSRN